MRTSDKDKRRGFVPLLGRAALAVFFCTALLWRCATIMTPTGGPKDTLPPVITLMTPDNFTTNFKDRKIYIEFDEFVQIKDQQKEFFTSPQMKKKPTITLRGRGISVQLRDTLRENTTYALNFGSAICDNNEGNPLYSMRYVFSTGPEIDSMVLSGYTVDAYKADSGEATIDMTLTAPNCPAADFIMEDVRQKIESIDGVTSATINLVFEPEWDKDMMSEEAKLELGFL